MTLAEIKLALIVLLGLAACAGVMYMHHRVYAEGDAAGYARARAEDDKALALERAAQVKQAADYQRQLQEASDANTKNQAELAALRVSTPVRHIVCRPAGPGDHGAVSSVPATTYGQSTNPGLDQAGDRPGFDPSPGLYAAADAADDAIEACRSALELWPHQVVSERIQ